MNQTNKSKRTSFIKAFINRIEGKIAIKTGIAAALSLILGVGVSELFHRPDTFASGLWCVMASIVVMQAHLGGTYKAAWIRFLGVFVGSIAGGTFISSIGTGPLSLGIGVCLTIIICSLLNIKDSFRIASLSTAVIIISAGLPHSSNPWLFSLYRFLDSCIGILVAVFVAHAIWPEKAAENLRQNTAKIMSLMSKFYRLAVNLEPETDPHLNSTEDLFFEIQELLQENRTYHEAAKLELLDRDSYRDNWASINNQLEMIFESISSLAHTQKYTLSKMFDDQLSNQVGEIIDKTDAAFQHLERNLSTDVELPKVNLDQSLQALSEEMLRFRGTHTTRKFNIEDVESFFVFFHGLRSVGESVKKLEEYAEQS